MVPHVEAAVQFPDVESSLYPDSLKKFGRNSLPFADLVSRVTPVHTALRNCTRDEGRSFEVGNQVLISNHRKLLCPKSTVVNVAEKIGTRFRKVWLREASASEPLMTCRKW